MIDTILFDLDGTLLPMDQDYFIENYFKIIAKKMGKYGVESIMKALKFGIGAMMSNDGTKTNEEAFWLAFYSVMPKQETMEKDFEEMYQTDFQTLIHVTQPTLVSKRIVVKLKEKNKRIILATNPLFPRIATESRIKWAGLDYEDFEWVTTFENSRFSKPNLAYYQELVEILGLDPKRCLMVGNDVSQDLIVRELGMKTYLVTDCLIHESEGEIVTDYEGSLTDFLSFVETLS